jgi:prepilin signal peptidase PulO-like enzyme (type II secretory pathway)
MIEIAILLGVLGAAFGSFAGAMAWRLHTKRNMVSDRSECEACHHKLGVGDLIPIASWLLLKGKCRYCKKPIGWLPFVAEVATATVFVLSYLYWPLGFETWQGITLFIMWLAYAVALAILLIYDARWMLLPDKIVFPLIAAAFIDAALRTSLVPGAGVTEYILHVGYGMLALAGIYGLLYAASKGRLVGFGDVKLSVFIGVILGWQSALLVFILANVIGSVVLLPGLVTGKLKRTTRVPFGPFLIAAFIIAGLWGEGLIRWYLGLIGL